MVFITTLPKMVKSERNPSTSLLSHRKKAVHHRGRRSLPHSRRWKSKQALTKAQKEFFPFRCKLAEGPRDKAPRDKEWATWPRRNNAGEASKVLFY
ncbi:hypothetical protein ES332_A10G153400v1 [Gossypium tomentosum]|uniref:Uncharacterized protein n=1 Tax=Gossypium tomentosum TaxID=34277 RepID=A0A5D2NQB1_GOSTO|nr:hypothetical protein ES332_A10G153400v1 [Gossypium tomentosum]